ncbi:MAG TPA: TA0938 family protein [Thermoplasmata archaeon]|nr:TA0938 family protein [Thermoplasmata archaeon]
MKVNYRGCAICDSSWGDHWEEVDGERRFFCCALCATQFRNLVERVHRTTGWDRIDAIEIQGDRTGRRVEVQSGAGRRTFTVMFTTQGEILQFREPPVPA